MTNYPSLPKTVLAVSVALIISGCGGGGGGGGGSSSPTNGSPGTDTPSVRQSYPTIRMSGAVVDGYIKGATVCLDLNLNSRCDDGEPSVTTGPDGRYTLELNPEIHQADLDLVQHRNFKKAPVVVQGGTDTDTNNPFLSVLSAPVSQTIADYSTVEVIGENADPQPLVLDSTNVTAVTSLLNRALERALAELDANKRAEVEAKVRAELGIPADINLNDDPIALLNEDKADFLAVNVSINRAIETLVATAGAGDENEWREISNNVYRALAIAVQEAVDQAATEEATPAGSVVAASTGTSAAERLLNRAASEPRARRVMAGLPETAATGTTQTDDEDARLRRLANAARIAATTARQTEEIYLRPAQEGQSLQERLQAAARNSTNVVRMVEAAVRNIDLSNDKAVIDQSAIISQSAQAAADASAQNALLIQFLRLRLIEGVDLTADSDLVKALQAMAGDDSTNEFNEILSLRAVYPYLQNNLPVADSEEPSAHDLVNQLLVNIEDTLKADVKKFVEGLGYKTAINATEVNWSGLEVTSLVNNVKTITLPANITLDLVTDLTGFPPDLKIAIGKTQNAIGLLRDFNITTSQADRLTLRGLEFFYTDSWDNNAGAFNRLAVLKDANDVPAHIKIAITEVLKSSVVVAALEQEGILVSALERDTILNTNFGTDLPDPVPFIHLDVGGGYHAQLPTSIQRKIQRTSRALTLLQELDILEDLSNDDIKALRGDEGIYSALSATFTVQQLYGLYLLDQEARSHLSALQDLRDLNQEKKASIAADGFKLESLPQAEQDALLWRPRDSEGLSDYPTLYSWIRAREVINDALIEEGLEVTTTESVAINQRISSHGGLSADQTLLEWLQGVPGTDVNRLITELTPFTPTTVTAAVANHLLNEVLYKSEIADDYAGPVFQSAVRAAAIIQGGIPDLDERTDLNEFCDQVGSVTTLDASADSYSLQLNNCYFTDWDETGLVHYIDGVLDIEVHSTAPNSLIELTINTPDPVTIAQEVEQQSGAYSHTGRSHPVFVRNWSVKALENDNDFDFTAEQQAELIEIDSADNGITLRLTDYTWSKVEIHETETETEKEEASFSYNFYQRKHDTNEEIAVRVFTFPPEEAPSFTSTAAHKHVTVDYPYVENGMVVARGADFTRVILAAHNMSSASALLRVTEGMVDDPACQTQITRDNGKIRNADICGSGSGETGGEVVDLEAHLAAQPASLAGSLSQLSNSDLPQIAETISEANPLAYLDPIVDVVRLAWAGTLFNEYLGINCSPSTSPFGDTGQVITFENCALTADHHLNGTLLVDQFQDSGGNYQLRLNTVNGPLQINDEGTDVELWNLVIHSTLDGTVRNTSYSADFVSFTEPGKQVPFQLSEFAATLSKDSNNAHNNVTYSTLGYYVQMDDGLTYQVTADSGLVADDNNTVVSGSVTTLGDSGTSLSAVFTESTATATFYDGLTLETGLSFDASEPYCSFTGLGHTNTCEGSNPSEPTEFVLKPIGTDQANLLLDKVLFKPSLAEDYASPAMQLALRAYALEFQIQEDEEYEEYDPRFDPYHTIFGDPLYTDPLYTANLCNVSGTSSWLETTPGVFTLQANACYFYNWDYDEDDNPYSEPIIDYLDGVIEFTAVADSSFIFDLIINTPDSISMAQEVSPDSAEGERSAEQSHPLYIVNWHIRGGEDYSSSGSTYPGNVSFVFEQTADLIEIDSSTDNIIIRLSDYVFSGIEYDSEDPNNPGNYLDFEETSFNYNIYQQVNNTEVAVSVRSAESTLLPEAALEAKHTTYRFPYLETGLVIATGADGTELHVAASSLQSATAQLIGSSDLNCAFTNITRQNNGGVENADICSAESGDGGSDSDYYNGSVLTIDHGAQIAEQLSEANYLGLAAAPLVAFAEQYFMGDSAPGPSGIFTSEQCYSEINLAGTYTDFTRYEIDFDYCAFNDESIADIKGTLIMDVYNQDTLGDGEFFSVRFNRIDTAPPLWIGNGEDTYGLVLNNFTYTLGQYNDNYGRSYRADHFAITNSSGGNPWHFNNYEARSFTYHEATGATPDTIHYTKLDYEVVMTDGLTFQVHKPVSNDSFTASDLVVDRSTSTIQSGELLAMGGENTRLWVNYSAGDGNGTLYTNDGDYWVNFNTADGFTTFTYEFYDGDYSGGDNYPYVEMTSFHINDPYPIEEAIRFGVRANPIDEAFEPLLQAVVTQTYYHAMHDANNDWDMSADGIESFCKDGGSVDVITTDAATSQPSYHFEFVNCIYTDWDYDANNAPGDNPADKRIDGVVQVEVTLPESEQLNYTYNLISMRINTDPDNLNNGKVNVGVNSGEPGVFESWDVTAQNLVREVGFIDTPTIENRDLVDSEVYALRLAADNLFAVRDGGATQLHLGGLNWEGRYFTFTDDPDNEVLDLNYWYVVTNTENGYSWKASFLTQPSLDEMGNTQTFFDAMPARAAAESGRFLTEGTIRVTGSYGSYGSYFTVDLSAKGEVGNQAFFTLEDEYSDRYEGSITHNNGYDVILSQVFPIGNEDPYYGQEPNCETDPEMCGPQ